MKLMIPLLILSLGLPAAAKPKKERRAHGAHVHGHAALAISFEGAQGRLDFRTPADAIVGFEHEAKTVAQKETVRANSEKFEKGLAEMVKWDASLNCRFEKAATQIKREKDDGHHSEFVAQADIACDKSPAETKVTFDFLKMFPKLRDVDATLLVDNLQKSAEIRSSGVAVELKAP